LDAELKTLEDKTKMLKDRKVKQLGELVIATGADASDIEMLAGALLDLRELEDQVQAERWRKRGAAFFRRHERDKKGGAGGNDLGHAPHSDGTATP
jgi:GH43 family beta-xylosidase